MAERRFTFGEKTGIRKAGGEIDFPSNKPIHHQNRLKCLFSLFEIVAVTSRPYMHVYAFSTNQFIDGYNNVKKRVIGERIDLLSLIHI